MYRILYFYDHLKTYFTVDKCICDFIFTRNGNEERLIMKAVQLHVHAFIYIYYEGIRSNVKSSQPNKQLQFDVEK